MKSNKIKGGVYSGKFWQDYINKTDAKRIAHKQERRRVKNEINKSLA